MALLSPNMKRVIIEGPVCDSLEVVGWHLKEMNNLTDTKTSPVHISSFAFNSSILWDPERWGRPSSVQDTTQVIPNLTNFLRTLKYILLRMLFIRNNTLLSINHCILSDD